MSRRVRVTPRAYADLKAIARYTRATWGETQRDAYLADLERRFAWLADTPDLGRPRPELGEGYRSYPQGAHVIFYIARERAIDIIGILHRSMDVEGYFGER